MLICKWCGVQKVYIPEGCSCPHTTGEHYWVEVDITERKSVLETLKAETDNDSAERAVYTLLQRLGVDTSQPGLAETPKRVVKAFREMLSGYNEEPEEILGKVFDESSENIVILKDIPYTSLCEHHLSPYMGTCDIGYIPNGGKVVGLSKLARLVDCFSRRLQIQERMTREIAEAIEKHLKTIGVAVVTKGIHSCMQCRGVRKDGATMICSSMKGVFMTEVAARAEFLALCRS